MTKDEQLEKMALFPVFGQLGADVRKKMGFSGDIMEKVQAAATDTEYAALGWNVVAKESLDGFADNLFNFNKAFSCDFEGALGLPGKNVVPKVTVTLSGVRGVDATLNPTNFETLGGGKYGAIEVGLNTIADGEDIPLSAIMDGHQYKTVVKDLIDSVALGAQKYILQRAIAAQVDVSGTAVAQFAQVTVPALASDGGAWGAGWANKNLTELIQPRVDSLMVNPVYYGGLKPENDDDLKLASLDFGSVAKISGVSELGENAVGLVCSKPSMAVAMRAPLMVSGGYNMSSTILKHAGTQLPLAVMTWFIPATQTIKVVVAALVGASRGIADKGKILVKATESDTEAAAETPTEESGTEQASE